MEEINYDIMRYDLDDDGYVCNVYFGCSSGTCVGYTGEVPEGYETLEQWADNANIRAYKIVDGNLVFDANRDYKLKILYEQEDNDNAHITKKELGMSSTEEINPYTDLFPSNQSAGGYITRVSEKFNRVGNLPTEEVNLSLLEEQDLDLIELEFIGNNFLPNVATSSVNNGIEYTQNKDKTINVKGTATDRSSLNLAGTDTSVRNILTFKANGKYLLFGLEDLNLEFYKYDGSDRTLIGIYNGGIISFEEDTNVTQVVLVVESGTTIDTTIKPMLQLVNLAYPVLPMTKYKGNLFNINSSNTSTAGNISATVDNYNLVVTNFGTTSSAYVTYKYLSIVVKPNTTYTLSVNSIINSTNYNPAIRITKLNSGSGSDIIGIVNSNNLSYTFTTDNETNYIGLFFYVSHGTIVSEETTITFEKIQLEEGIIATPYKEYNGRNGQYYVDGVSTQETRSGKNLLNPNGNNNSINGIDFINNGDGTFTAKGTATKNTSFTLSNELPILKNNTNYTLSLIILENNGDLFSTPISVLNEDSTIHYNYLTVNPNKLTQTILTTWETQINSISFYVQTGKVIDSTFKLQLEEGTTATEYEAYGISPSPDYPSEIINIYKAGTYNVAINNKVYTITIPEDLRSVPNGVADRLWFDIDGNNGIDIEKKVGSLVLDGSENWTSNQTTDNEIRFHSYILPVRPKTTNIGLSNYFKVQSEAYKSGISLYSDGNGIFIWISKTITSSADDFKTWLSTHNTEVQYELTTYTTSNIPEYSGNEYEYEEYKNNTTLIDLAGNTFEVGDDISIKGNQIVLIKSNGEEIFLGDTVMPRTYTPYTHAYCHQKVYIDFKYKDPRNVDITKINLKGLISITDVETEYNFGAEDLTKVQNYIMGIEDLTNEELDLYDINGDGVITASDYAQIRNMANGVISNKVKGTLEINSTQSKRTIVLRDEDGKILTSLGLNGISTPSLSINGVLVEEKIDTSETPTTAFLNGKRVYKKLFTGTMPSTSGSNVSLANLDFEFAEAWIDQSLSFLTKDVETIPTSFYYSPTCYLRTWVNKDTTPHIRIRAGEDFSSYKYNIVVAYTKDDGSEETEEPETPSENIVEVNEVSTITGSTSSSNWTFKTVATEESVDKENKTSTVTITNYIGRPTSSNSSYFMGTLTINYKCGDQSESETVYKNSGTVSSGGWYKLGSRTFTIAHTEEPMKINVGGSMSTSDFSPSSASANGSITLTTI